MNAARPNSPRSLRIEPDGISGALETWLDTLALDGLDAVRAALALSLARELDDPEAPRYSKARTAAELRNVVAEITAQPRTQRSVEALLAQVAG